MRTIAPKPGVVTGIQSLTMHFSEIRQTLGRLWENQGFCSSVVLTLGLGIGRRSLSSGIIYAVMIRPCHSADPRASIPTMQAHFLRMVACSQKTATMNGCSRKSVWERL